MFAGFPQVREQVGELLDDPRHPHQAQMCQWIHWHIALKVYHGKAPRAPSWKSPKLRGSLAMGQSLDSHLTLGSMAKTGLSGGK